MPPGRIIRGYCRELDLTSGEVAVRWASDAGVFSRELFVSRVDGVVVMRIQADGGHFDARVSLAPHGWQAGIVIEGSSRAESMPDTETTFRAWSDGEIVGIDAQQVDGTTFGGILSVVADGGSWSSTDGTISFDAATSATLVLGIHVDEPSESARRLFLESWSTRTIDYDEMLRRHREEHQRLMSTFDLTIGESQAQVGGEDRPETADRSAASLIELLAVYGRYLFISSSRPEGWPVNLQGVWNGDYEPTWSSDYHNDENVRVDVLAGPPRRAAGVAATPVRLSREPSRRLSRQCPSSVRMRRDRHPDRPEHARTGVSGAVGQLDRRRWMDRPVLLPVLGVHAGSRVPRRTCTAVHARGRSLLRGLPDRGPGRLTHVRPLALARELASERQMGRW